MHDARACRFDRWALAGFFFFCVTRNEAETVSSQVIFKQFCWFWCCIIVVSLDFIRCPLVTSWHTGRGRKSFFFPHQKISDVDINASCCACWNPRFRCRRLHRDFNPSFRWNALAFERQRRLLFRQRPSTGLVSSTTIPNAHF
jgi:hypothetical protein